MDKRPNIVIILADDMGYSDIGCYGGEIDTPNIDKLAKKGMRFTQFYNNARCCPSRACMLTGLYPHMTGIGHMTNPPNATHHDLGLYGYRGVLNHECVTIAEVLKNHGYHTYLSGKWHVGQNALENWPLQRGFERFYGILCGSCNYFRPKEPRGLMFGNEHCEIDKEDFYTTDAFTDYAIRFLKEKNEDNPFFLYLAFNAPHWPLQAKKEDVDKYVGKYMCGWDEIREKRYRRMIESGIIRSEWKLSQRDPEICPWVELDEKKKIEMDFRMAVYAAQVYRMDYNIGRLVDFLEENDALHNTLILFLSDNGGCAEGGDYGGGPFAETNATELSSIVNSYGKAWANASNTPFKYYKRFVHEGGVAMPMIAYWPDEIKEQCGEINHSVGYLIDIMPTILEISGSTYPKELNGNRIHPLDGKSLFSVFKTGSRVGHEYMFWEHEDNCSIRNNKWKALQKYDTGEWELYDLDQDRTEQNNLSEKYPEIVTDLSVRWHEWAKTHYVSPKINNMPGLL